MQRYMVFDTETTGIPTRLGYDKYHSPEKWEYYQSSRIVQISWTINSLPENKCMNSLPENNSTNSLTENKSTNSLTENKSVSKTFIISGDYHIPNSHIHGITDEISDQKGIPIETALTNFLTDLSSVSIIVAHNMDFDMNIIMAELLHSQLDTSELTKKQQYCTMRESKRIFQFDKNPKLSELFFYLFPKETWIQKHDAEDDVKICEKCFLKLFHLEKDNKKCL